MSRLFPWSHIYFFIYKLFTDYPGLQGTLCPQDFPHETGTQLNPSWCYCWWPAVYVDTMVDVLKPLLLQKHKHKLQVPWLSYNWWGSQAWDALQDSTGNSSINEIETRLEWQEYFSQFQDTSDALPCLSHLLVSCESWTLTVELQRRIQAMKMRCNHKIPHISDKDCVTYGEVHAKIQQAIGPHKDLTIIQRCKLQWYGHVSHSSGLAKTILGGTMKGERRQGKWKKRWEDYFREWTGVEFAKSQRAMENREKRRKLIVKSSVVPQQPLQLRDRWWWWRLHKHGMF